ncbi:MAG: acyl-CoA dehydrogenase family protein [Pseudomonadota bacterium]
MSEAYRSPWMDEELEMLKEGVRKFFTREFVPDHKKWIEQGRVDQKAWAKAGEAGFLCAAIPDTYGGGGGNFAHEAVIAEELFRSGIGDGFANGVHSTIVAPYILQYGTEEQKQKWLPKMASGEMVGAIAMTEPGTGSDLQSVRTTAVKDGDSYVINGQKTFITNGQNAGLIIVVAKTEPDKGSKGISLVVVEPDQVEGFTRGRNLDKIGQHAADTSELFFDNVRVPLSNLLGEEEGKGFVQLMQQLPQERLVIGLSAVVVMEMAVEATVEYTKQRKAFGQSLLDFQNTRFKLAECKTEAHVARVFVDDCMMRLMEGKLDTATASMAKWWTTQKQCDIVDECLQLHGGYGYMSEFPIAKMYVDSRVQKIYGGTNEIMKEVIARTL